MKWTIYFHPIRYFFVSVSLSQISALRSSLLHPSLYCFYVCLYAFCRVFVYILFFFFVFFVSIDALDGLLDHLVGIIQPENLLIGDGSHETLFPSTGIMIFKHWKFQTFRICDKWNDWISYLLKSLAAKKAT